MNTYLDGVGGVEAVMKWLVVGILVVVALKVGLAIAGVVVGVLFFALFAVGPVLIVGWLVLKLLRHFAGETGDAAI